MLLPALERHGRRKLGVLRASAATIDRLLSDVKIMAPNAASTGGAPPPFAGKSLCARSTIGGDLRRAIARRIWLRTPAHQFPEPSPEADEGGPGDLDQMLPPSSWREAVLVVEAIARSHSLSLGAFAASTSTTTAH